MSLKHPDVNVVKYFFHVFKPPTAETLAKRELEDNKRMLLEAQRTKTYAGKMVEFYETRIREINSMLKSTRLED